MKSAKQYQVVRETCPKCAGRKTQENYSIHGKPTGKAECCVCGGKGSVVKR